MTKTALLCLPFVFFLSLFVSVDLVGQQEASSAKKPFQDRLISAMFNQAVMRDLELIDDQRVELQTVLKDLRQMQGELRRELQEFQASGGDAKELESRRQAAIQKLEEKKTKSLKQIEDILLPHQMDRLRQSTVQVMMRESAKQEKVTSGLLTKPMMEYLEIDADQAKEIRKSAESLQKELVEKVEKLRAEATEKLLKNLTPEQRKKYRELIGDDLKNLR